MRYRAGFRIWIRIGSAFLEFPDKEKGPCLITQELIIKIQKKAYFNILK